MLCLLSPTKTLAEEACARATAMHSVPVLGASTRMLVARCKMLTKAELKSTMSLSDNLAALNHTRYQGFEEQPAYPAARLFDGPSFRALNVNDMAEDELARLDKSLVVLSGLYGLLRPNDAMRPYRLEMGTRLDVDGCPNLYKFWAKHGLTDQLAAIAKQNEAHTILNCASQEYAKAVDFTRLREEHGLNVVQCTFTAATGRMASVFAKQARGMMVRFVAKAAPSNLEELQRFSGAEGLFKFAPRASSETELVFKRHLSVKTPGGDEATFGGSKPTELDAEKPSPAEPVKGAAKDEAAQEGAPEGAQGPDAKTADGEPAKPAPPKSKKAGPKNAGASAKGKAKAKGKNPAPAAPGQRRSKRAKQL